MRTLSELEIDKLHAGICPKCGERPAAYHVAEVQFAAALIELNCCGFNLALAHPQIFGWPQSKAQLSMARANDDEPKLIGEGASVEARAQAAAVAQKKHR